MGVVVRETSMETSTAVVSTTENSRNRRPTMPPMNRMGVNTATREMEMDTTVKPTSRAPRRAARRGLSPVTLDDPFSALDRATETEIFAHLRRLAADSVVILISHRLYLFPELDRVIWLENGEAKVGTHEELVGNTPDYAAQFDAQREENSHE